MSLHVENNTTACPQCGSTTTHVDFGRTFCANGHEQALGLVAEDDEADFLRTRGGRLHRDSRKDGERGGERTTTGGGGRILKGKEAWELWAKAWGLLLWRVCWSVAGLTLDGKVDDGGGGGGGGNSDSERRKEMGGEEMWSVVRGLWALRLGELAGRWQEVVGDIDDVETDASGGGESEDIRGTGTDTDAAEGSTKSTAESRFKLSEKKGTLKLVDTVALNYIALLLMRHPISLSRLYTWLQTEAIPYLRAIRHVPREMRGRLPPELHRALDTTTLLRPEDLQLVIYRNAKLYRKQFGMVLPPLNWRPLLLEWLEVLALPLQVYGMVKQLNTICEFDFAYSTAIDSRRSVLTFPEVQLMALMIVAVKLLFPFDASRVKRYPKSGNEPGLIRLDWNVWVEAKEWFINAVDGATEELLQPGKEMLIKDRDVVTMSDQQVDAYMDWYQRMWMSQKDDGQGVQRELLAMFPTQPMAEDNAEERARRRERRIKELRQERLAKVLGGLKARKVVTDQNLEELEEQQPGIRAKILRPGMKYQVFQRIEDLDGAAEQFHDEAALTACVSLKGLLRSVVKAENKIDKWRREKRRESAFKEEDVEVMMDLDLAATPARHEDLVEDMTD